MTVDRDTGRLFPPLDHLAADELRLARRIGDLAVVCSQLTDDFAQVKRMPRLSSGERESDVEHSFTLAILAPEVARILGLDLDHEKITKFALIHDLVEVKVGDVSSFNLSPEQFAEKERREQLAKEELLGELPLGIATDLDDYERQDSPEAIFVRTVDKLMPLAADITGSGVRVAREDYDTKTLAEVSSSQERLHAALQKRFGTHFPDVVNAHAILAEMFVQKCINMEDELTRNTTIERSSIEVERKFAIDLDQGHLDEIIARAETKSAIRQGYIAIGTDGSETRVRSFDDNKFVMTIKTTGDISRSEQNIDISREMFDALWDKTADRRVEKTRYYIPYDDYTIELDIYAGDLAGLATAEVEFSAGGKREADALVRAATFTPPEWFGDDVTNDKSYKNQSLAQHGIPAARTPISY